MSGHKCYFRPQQAKIKLFIVRKDEGAFGDELVEAFNFLLLPIAQVTRRNNMLER